MPQTENVGKGTGRRPAAGKKTSGAGNEERGEMVAGSEPMDVDGMPENVAEEAAAEPMNTGKEKAETHQLLERARAAALLGYAKVSLLAPPNATTTLNWGRLNKRAISNPDVQILRQNFHQKGRRPWDHPVDVLVQQKWIDKSLLKGTANEVAFKDMPLLKIKDHAGKIQLQFMSGNHRREACWQEVVELKKQLAGVAPQGQEGGVATKGKGKGKGKATEEKAVVNESEGKKKEREKEAKRLSEEIEEMSQWVVAVYDQEKIDKTLELHISSNDVLPRRVATKEELMFFAYLRLRNHMETQAGVLSAESLTPGTSAWVTMLTRFFGDEELQASGYRFMFMTQIGMSVLEEALSFGYYQDGEILKVDRLKQLLHRMTKNDARAGKGAGKSVVKEVVSAGPPCGYMWADVFTALVRQMKFVAQSKVFIPPQDIYLNQGDVEKASASDIAMINYLRLSRGQPLLIDKETHASMSFLDLGNAATMVLAQKEQRGVATTRYEAVMAASGGDVEDLVWDAELMAKVDNEYLEVRKTWRGGDTGIDRFGDTNNEEWRQAMKQYWHHVSLVTKEHWGKAKAALTSPQGGVPVSDPRVVALTNAERRMVWLMHLRNARAEFDLPFPTKSFLLDFSKYCQGYVDGMGGVLRFIDPMFDTVLHRTVDSSGMNDVFDVSGYLAAYLRQQHMFHQSPSVTHELWRWIMENRTAIAALDLVIKKNPLSSKWNALFELTAAKWIDAKYGFFKGLKGDGPPHAPPKELLALLKFSDKDFDQPMRQSISTAYAWIYPSMKTPPNTKKDAPTRVPPPPPPPPPYVHPVARATPELYDAVAATNLPQLWMLYRHIEKWYIAGGDGIYKVRSKPLSSLALSYRTCLLAKHYKEVTVPACNYQEVADLRTSLFTFLTKHARDVCLAPPKNDPSAPPAWVNWDYDIFDSVMETIDDDDVMLNLDTSQPQLESWDRWHLYDAEIKRLIALVTGFRCARGRGPTGDAYGIHPWLIKPLDMLCKALLRNAERMEIRELHTNDYAIPIVLPPHGLRSQHKYKLPSPFVPKSSKLPTADLMAFHTYNDFVTNAPNYTTNAYGEAVEESDSRLGSTPLPQTLYWSDAQKDNLRAGLRVAISKTLSPNPEKLTAEEIKEEHDDPTFKITVIRSVGRRSKKQPDPPIDDSDVEDEKRLYNFSDNDAESEAAVSDYAAEPPSSQAPGNTASENEDLGSDDAQDEHERDDGSVQDTATAHYARKVHLDAGLIRTRPARTPRSAPSVVLVPDSSQLTEIDPSSQRQLDPDLPSNAGNDQPSSPAHVLVPSSSQLVPEDDVVHHKLHSSVPSVSVPSPAMSTDPMVVPDSQVPAADRNQFLPTLGVDDVHMADASELDAAPLASLHAQFAAHSLRPIGAVGVRQSVRVAEQQRASMNRTAASTAIPEASGSGARSVTPSGSSADPTDNVLKRQRRESSASPTALRRNVGAKPAAKRRNKGGPSATSHKDDDLVDTSDEHRLGGGMSI